MWWETDRHTETETQTKKEYVGIYLPRYRCGGQRTNLRINCLLSPCTWGKFPPLFLQCSGVAGLGEPLVASSFGPLPHLWSADILDTCLHHLFVWTLGSKLSGRLTWQVTFHTSCLPSYFREGSCHWLRLNPFPFPCLLSVLGIEPRVLRMLSMYYFTTELHSQATPFSLSNQKFVHSNIFGELIFGWAIVYVMVFVCSFCCIADCSTHISVT